MELKIIFYKLFLVSLVLVLMGTYTFAKKVHQTSGRSTSRSPSTDVHLDAGVLFDAGKKGRMEKIQARRWPDKTIPVIFTGNYPERYQEKVYDAMGILNELTCLNMREATESDEYTLKVINSKPACYATLGYANRKEGYQIANLHPSCFIGGPGTVIHELIHTIGFHHQQVRADRDAYITVHNDTVDPKKMGNFRKTKGKDAFLATFGIPYDYNSVMQYPSTAFNMGAGRTITVNTNFPGFLGQVDGPTRSDIAAINRMYGCWDHYLGDDITGAVPYKDFHDGYMSKRPKFSRALKRWTENMRKLVTATSEL